MSLSSATTRQRKRVPRMTRRNIHGPPATIAEPTHARRPPAYIGCRITQGAIEAINGIIQLAKRRARGFRNFSYLRTIAYWVAAKLKVPLPSLLPIQNSGEPQFLT